MRIGEVANRAGVNIQTVRLYERLGLLEKPRRLPSGYRDYPAGAARLIRSIKQAQGLGFTLSEIKSLIELSKQSATNTKQARAMAEAKIRDLDEKIRQLQTMRAGLAHQFNTCGCGDGRQKCLVVEVFNESGQED